jgi:hypothetical protein
METLDGGATWGASAQSLVAYERAKGWSLADRLLIFAMPSAAGAPGLWTTDARGTWSPVAADLAIPDDRPTLTSVAYDDRHIVVVGTTIGTGAGGSAVLVWWADR